jgi:pyruvate dehydrogenase E1 component alpha subunit
VHALPAVFVCENNFYGEFTPMQKVTGGRDIAGRGAAYGIGSVLVDGNDLWAVEDAAREAVARARAEHVPALLECQTYRHYGHSKSDPATYRPKEEVERWLERDPLKIARERLVGMGADVEAAERGAREAMDRAVEAALASPYPEPGGATEYAA